MTNFENLLITHTAPTLLGIKQANLFSFPLKNINEYRIEIEKYNKLTNKLDIYIDYLYCCSKRVFVIVYRRSMLLNYFKQPSVANFLVNTGYPKSPWLEENFKQTISCLRKRTNNYSEFPHEIGFFLGYPSNDVFEYINQKGENFKFCGYWKVYSNEHSAKLTFKNYEKCKKVLFNKVTSGTSILKILGAA